MINDSITNNRCALHAFFYLLVVYSYGEVMTASTRPACLLISSSCYFFPRLNFRLFVLSNVGARYLQPINTPRVETIITTSDTASLWHATAVSSRRGRVVWVHRAKFNTKLGVVCSHSVAAGIRLGGRKNQKLPRFHSLCCFSGAENLIVVTCCGIICPGEGHRRNWGLINVLILASNPWLSVTSRVAQQNSPSSKTLPGGLGLNQSPNEPRRTGTGKALIAAH